MAPGFRGARAGSSYKKFSPLPFPTTLSHKNKLGASEAIKERVLRMPAGGLAVDVWGIEETVFTGFLGA